MSSENDEQHETERRGGDKSGKSRTNRRTWEEGFEDLRTFFDEHGHSRPKATSLTGRWAAIQRRRRRSGELSGDQIRQMDELQFDWDSQEDKLEEQWQEMCQLLRQYKIEHGHTRVRQKEHYKGESLGNWVTSQQSLYRDGKIKDHRKEQLESMGFEWVRDERLLWKDTRPLGKFNETWDEKFALLCNYKDEQGDTLVPPDHMARLENGDVFCLGAFVSRQRILHRDGLLRREREEKLKTIGFVFTIDIYDAEASKHQKSWDDIFNRLCQYKEKEGDCNVPAVYDADPELGAWARHQRALHSRDELAPMRFNRLDDIGFTWAPHSERWKEMVNHLRSYKLVNGDCKVPYSYQTKDGANLGSWVRTVRGSRNGTRNIELSPEKIAELDALGFVWENVLHLHWDIMYEALRKYRETHGHSRVPQSYKGDSDDLPTGLGQWVSNQRLSLEKKLEETKDPMYIERKEKLDAIGFEWSLAHIPQDNWNAMLEGLKQYKAQYGDYRVPYTYNGASDGLPRKLGQWVYAQRSTIPGKAAEGNPMFVERKRWLDEIHFLWEDNSSHENWMKMYQRLKEYQSVHGHCRVPSGYNHDHADLPSKLDNWVGVQKLAIPAKAENGNPIYVERKRLLDLINFQFDKVHEAKWECMYERLKQYYSVHGNCRVPGNYDDGSGGPSLHVWARYQRRNVPGKAGQGDSKYVERKRLLDSLHFEYDKVDEATWMAMFHVLKQFSEDHGHSNVPLSYGQEGGGDAPRALGRWCHEQRKNVPAGLAKSKVSNDYKERKRLLDSIGFEWEVVSEKEKKWNAFFERLKRFKEKRGHCRVPPDLKDCSDESSLYSWVKNQQAKVLRKADSGDTVFVERKRRLNSIGFEWTGIFDGQWEKMFESLVEYKNKHGHCRVPYRGKGAVDGPSGQLGIWVYRQRTDVPQKASKHDPVYVERKQRLDSIGFEWLDVHSSKWEVMFAGLQRFHQKHGHCRVKRDYKDVEQPLPANLGSWLSTQRINIPQSIMQGDDVATDRKQRLDSLGFTWQTRAPPKSYTRHGKLVQGRDASSSSGTAKRRQKEPNQEYDDASRRRDASSSRGTTKRRQKEPGQEHDDASRKAVKSRRASVASDARASKQKGPRKESPQNVKESLPPAKKVRVQKAAKAAGSLAGEAPGPGGALVAFPDYDGSEEPAMWKNEFGQFRRRLRKTVKESLDPSERTKEKVKQALQSRWSQLADNEKSVYRQWAAWDKARYERDVAIFGQRKKAAASIPRKRKTPPSKCNLDASIPRKRKFSHLPSEDQFKKKK